MGAATFSDEDVVRTVKKEFVLAYSKGNRTLLKEFKIPKCPVLIFIDREGKEVKRFIRTDLVTRTEMHPFKPMKPEKFRKELDAIVKKVTPESKSP